MPPILKKKKEVFSKKSINRKVLIIYFSKIIIARHDSNVYVKKIESAGFVVTFYKDEEVEETQELIRKYSKVMESVLKLINNFGGEEFYF